MSAAEIKKPPVAPKPKNVLGQKPSPPPVAPKPDVNLSNTVQAPKKSKPAIAPKPNIVKGSSVQEDSPQWTEKTYAKRLDAYKGSCSESVKCKNEITDSKSSTYIISTSSSTCDCTYKPPNGDYLPKPQKVIDRIENLENKKVCGQPVPCTRPRRKPCNPPSKLAKTNQVLLKSGVEIGKVKDVISNNAFQNGHAYQRKNCDTSEVSQRESSAPSPELWTNHVDGHNKPETYSSSSPAHGVSPFCSDSNKMENKHSNGDLLADEPLTTENDRTSLARALPPQKVLPVPKPRKLRTPCLIRQDCIESPSEFTEDSVSLTISSEGLFECRLKDTEQSRAPKDLRNNCKESILPEPVCENLNASIPDQGSEIENGTFIEHSDVLLSKSSKDTRLQLNEENCNFVRCSSLSMSLPKQLKLVYEKQLSLKKSSNGVTEKSSTSNELSENSPRIVPKKPQRYSLPASGLLKRSASEERLNQSCDKLILEDNDSVKEQDASCSVPNKASEKPAWKLPHPILPFLGSPKSLKVSSSCDMDGNPVTKPRAKSLSSVDMERIERTKKESPKKGPLRKLLNMKLSVCVIKSDFQKFLCRGSQSPESTINNGHCSTESSTFLDLSNKSRPTKAHSADSCSPLCQKKRKRHRSEGNIVKNHTSLSLEDVDLRPKPQVISSNLLSSDVLPDYENVRHYEEIPEYENLPYALVLDKSECDPAIYEVEDPNQPPIYSLHKNAFQSDPLPVYADDELGIVHSDEEEIINSSDEEDFSSDSSRVDLDHPEYKQKNKAAQKTKTYHIAKEIMSSEKVFVDALKLLHIDFRYAVAQAPRHFGKPVIEEKILNQILYYLPQLYELNRDVLRELEERMSQWTEQQKISDIFVKKGPYLKMYSTYIREFDRNISLLDDQCKKNPGFAEVVRYFEMSPRCANLALKHYLLKPVQRIPQYRLLLTDYLKNLSEDSSDYNDTQAALIVVIEVANHANDILKQGDNFQKLIQIQYSLNGHHEIVQPGRVFLKEGTLMKLSRKVMQPRMFYLFNDALLYTTPVQSGTYKLNNMLSLAGMKVRKPTQEAYQNELNIESVERSFILSASSASERDDWLEAISLAIEEYAKKKITFSPTKSLEEADPGEKADCTLGSKAPIWIPDGRVTMCMICTSEFTLTWRRHHCRACGKIICQACSTNKYSLEYLKNHLARVCDRCFQVLEMQESLSTPKTGSPANHKSPSNALSTVLHSIPSGRKQKKIPAALKVSASTEDSSMSGYLQRSKASKKQWKQLWFVIKNKVLYTYAASEDIAALESQPLLGFTVKEVKDDITESTIIHLLHKNTLFYIFKADDAHTTQRWIEAFQEGTVL
ncbi:FYVE, RhoGEF and PH domain-containing protein 6 isoform X1 [Xenopus laevis]|uniref:FYVE, RhoGEF and PH domain-containing protein 6 n=2 Tax=Xenopus laevis TaxID=8355 RepID=A0A974DBP8_XENLA|nr:FYVE, RhoGEF and PH domain-containing protein 6 isoform X1 [Xenopus laevis]OCT88858.1 hypothetical protein XELAEV_18017488mg [Xenopus laevis]